MALAVEFHHPFDDGNGRMSRLLMNLILMRHGYPITVIKADETTRNRYLAALSEADAGEPEPFLRFIIENVEASLRLMLRAARGEAIDEPSDLDKKLALLKKQVFTQYNATQGIWNTRKQETIFDELLNYWLTDLENETSRFDELFGRKEYISAVYFGPKSLETITPTSKPSLAIEFINKSFKSVNKLSTGVSLAITWENIRIDNTFIDVTLNINFIFQIEKIIFLARIIESTPNYNNDAQTRIVDLKIEDISNKTKLSYASPFDTNQIHEINYQLANKVYDFIVTKLAEADKPPA